MKWSEFLKSKLNVAKADTKLFYEPYVALFKFLKRNFTHTAVKQPSH